MKHSIKHGCLHGTYKYFFLPQPFFKFVKRLPLKAGTWRCSDDDSGIHKHIPVDSQRGVRDIGA